MDVEITVMPPEAKQTICRRRRPANDPYIGLVLSGRYRVLQRLGEGGMSTIYLAEHLTLGRRVALKILSNASFADAEARFVLEARATSRMSHESIVDVIDFGRCEDGTTYFVMEYLRGIDLGQRIATNGPLSFAVVRNIVLQLCSALGEAHKQGVVHRDLKPQNVFLSTIDGRHDVVKLIDFGVAKMLSPGEVTSITARGRILGTPAYVSPEQAECRPVDARSDIYSLGCLMYEMLTTEVPFAAPSAIGVIDKHLHEAPQPPTERRAEAQIPRELEAIVLRALAKRPEDRFQSTTELAKALHALSPDLPSVRAAPVVPPPVARRRRVLPILAAIAIFTAAATATVLHVRHHRAVAQAAR
jgi:serine/threonine-protein kinase